MDLFADQRRRHAEGAAPLPVRVRPRTLDEFLGQDHFLGPGKLLRRMLKSDRLVSAIFCGPPGTGKTTLAHIIAAATEAEFVEVNAASIGVREIRRILDQARQRLETAGQRTVLFIDELHHFSRTQQDVLLGDVESGVVILIGATTQNPSFSVNSPLLSRSQVFRFKPLDTEHVVTLMRRALADDQRGFGRLDVWLTDEAATHLAVMCDGDARRALMALEVAVLSQVDPEEEGNRPKDMSTNPIETARRIVIDLSVAADSIQAKALDYDASGDGHYDCASALIKSIRGSDPDATVYWLARMLESGEDPRFVARRIVISASEDIGNADPQGLVVAQAAADAVTLLGMPECQLPLAQAAIYLACAPKSNACATAVWDAGKDVRESRTVPVPRHLRDTHYPGSRFAGAGEGYAYPHDHPEGLVAGQYMGVDKVYYCPTGRGYEARIAEYLERCRSIRTGKTKEAVSSKPSATDKNPIADG